MTDRSNIKITIGGNLPGTLEEEFFSILELEDARNDFDEAPFSKDDLVYDKPIELYITQASWGSTRVLEAFLREQHLAYKIESDAAHSAYGPSLTLYEGNDTEPVSWGLTSTFEPCLTRNDLRSYPDLDAAIAALTHVATFPLPPFTIENYPDCLPVNSEQHIEALRDAGYAVAVWTPQELGDVSIDQFEDLVIERGNISLDMLRASYGS